MFKHSGRWVKAIRAACLHRFRFLHAQGTLPPWRPAQVLDEYVRSVPVPSTFVASSKADCAGRWVQREARPISLRQLTFFGRTLTETRLISSANYVRTELPTRSLVLLIRATPNAAKVIQNAGLRTVSVICKRCPTSWSRTPTCPTSTNYITKLLRPSVAFERSEPSMIMTAIAKSSATRCGST